MLIFMRKTSKLFDMRILYSLCFVPFLISPSMYSQDSTKVKNVKQEVITRVVTVKDTAVIKTTTEKNIEEEQIIKIEDTGEENQNIEFTKDKKETLNVSEEVRSDKTNEERIQEIKEAQLKEIQESKKEQLLRAQEEKKIIDQRKEVLEMKRLQKKKDSLKNCSIIIS